MQRVIGWFEIDGIHRGSPHFLWLKYRAEGALARAAFRRYFASCAVGAAIEVGRTFRISDPMPLAALSPTLRPPQSYRYLEGDAAATLGIPA